MIHLEFFAILYLVALPFILHFYQSDNFFYIILLLFLDFSFLWLIDETYIQEQLGANFLKIVENEHFKRVMIYMLGIIVGTIMIGFTSVALFLIIVINDIALSILDRLVKKMIHKYKKSKM